MRSRLFLAELATRSPQAKRLHDALGDGSRTLAEVVAIADMWRRNEAAQARDGATRERMERTAGRITAVVAAEGRLYSVDLREWAQPSYHSRR